MRMGKKGHIMKYIAAIFGLSLVLSYGHIGDAHAALEICNETETRRSVAIAFKDGDDWKSKGWWNIPTNECRTVVKGDLQQRYYYYRAIHKGKEVKAGDYNFCATLKAFDIKGDTDCASRGYEVSSFRVIDTGTSAKDFKFNLKFKVPKAKGSAKKLAKKQEAAAPKAKAQTAAKPKPIIDMTKAPKFTSDPFSAGSLGEPFTVIGVFQGCDNIDGWDHCAYHAEGWRHGASWNEGTPDTIMQALEQTAPGTRMLIRGDMKSFGDITAEVAIRQIEPVPYEHLDAVLEALQGSWESDKDSSEYFTIYGSERRGYYDGNLTGNDYLSWQTGCGRVPQGSGVYMIVTNPEDREDPPCFAVESVGRNRLTLLFIGGNGQFQEFTRQR